MPFFLLVFLPLCPLSGADAYPSLPRIKRLDHRDPAFAQYLGDVENSRRLLFLAREGRGPGGHAPERIAGALTIYTYVPGEGEDLFTLAARCSIPYGTIASVNRLAHPEDLRAGRVLLLPSIPGIFIPQEPETDLERLIASSRNGGEGVSISLGEAPGLERFFFIPGADLSPPERVFFLNRGFRFPLRHFRLTSPYGPRINPVTGIYGVHQGVDLAAPEGSPVYAAREGTVRELGEDPIYGRYIILSHGDDWVSLYGHLSKIETVLREEVQSGTLIGRVGSSGQSTGPHLHFELRQNGQARDPGRLLRIFKD